MYLENFCAEDSGIKESKLESRAGTASRTRAALAILATQEPKTADTNSLGAVGVAAYRRTETCAGFWNVRSYESYDLRHSFLRS